MRQKSQPTIELKTRHAMAIIAVFSLAVAVANALVALYLNEGFFLLISAIFAFLTGVTGFLCAIEYNRRWNFIRVR